MTSDRMTNDETSGSPTRSFHQFAIRNRNLIRHSSFVIPHSTSLFPLASLLLLAASCARPIAPTTRPLATPRDLPGVSNFAQLSPVLYRGAQPTPAGFEMLRQMGIKTIVDVRGKSHRDSIEGTGLRYVQIPSSVSRPDTAQVLEFLRIVRDPLYQPIFVHDDLGADRTALYVAAYRMVEQDWTARDAEAELPRFHFDKYWSQIPAFLEHLDVESIRGQLDQPPSTQKIAK
jgi:tyrosine-protein phosphatase SIW14